VGSARIPAQLDGDVVRIGIPARLGFCTAWGIEACGRLVKRGATEIVLTFGRAYGGANQTWVAFEQDGRSWVADRTLSEQRFPAGDYLAAIHATKGTSIAVPDQATVDALRRYCRKADPWDVTPAEFIERIAPPVRRKE
jgi:hypothetical protein